MPRMLRFPLMRAVLVVCLFASLGLLAMFLADAASPAFVIEPESGTRLAGATPIPDPSASGGAYIRFASPTTSGVNKARPFAANSPWNTLTPSTTRWYDYPALHVSPGTTSPSTGFVNFLYSTTWSSSSDPMWTFQLTGYSAPEWHRVMPTQTVRMRAPISMATSDPGNDQLITIADPVSGDYIEMFRYKVDKTDPNNLRVYADPAFANDGNKPLYHTGNMITGTGVGVAATNKGAGARASNFTWAAGQITQADISAGKIDHALEVTLPGEMVLGGPGVFTCPNGPGPSILPATAGNGCWPTGRMPLGTKIGIPASTPKPAAIASNPIGNMVFDALQRYGAYVGDVGGQPQIMFAADWGSFGYPSTLTSLDTTVFDPLIGCWGSHPEGCTPAFPIMQPLLRVADYQP